MGGHNPCLLLKSDPLPRTHKPDEAISMLPANLPKERTYKREEVQGKFALWLHGQSDPAMRSQSSLSDGHLGKFSFFFTLLPFGFMVDPSMLTASSRLFPFRFSSWMIPRIVGIVFAIQSTGQGITVGRDFRRDFRRDFTFVPPAGRTDCMCGPRNQ